MGTVEASVPAAPSRWVTEAAQADPYARERLLLFLCTRLGLPTLLFTVALSLRLPYLMEVPGFTDETVEMQVAVDALQGRWPLVDVEPYLGSLFNYLLAGGFLLLGQHGYVGRFVVTVMGALTVVLAYYLARRLGGRTVALLAAALMATSGVHIVNGHIAWTNGTTPFFTTACLLALAESTARRNGLLLVVAGLLYGLALQTHPAVLVLAPAIIVYCLSTQHSALRTPWPYLAALAAFAGYGNVLAYSWQHPTAFWEAVRKTDYAYVPNPTIDTYLLNLEGLAAAVLRMVASSFSGGSTPDEQLSMLTVAPYAAALAAGLIYAVWRRQGLLLMLAVTSLVIPYFNKDYSFPIAARYLGYLLPVVYLLVAMPLGHALEWTWLHLRLAVPILGVACLALLVLPIANLQSYYDGYLRANATSPTLLALEAEIRTRYQVGLYSEVLLDPQLDWLFTAPGGRVLRAFNFLLNVEQVPHRTVSMVPEKVAEEMVGTESPLVLVMSEASRQRLASRFRLLPMEVPNRPYLNRNDYWAYVLLPSKK